ncbi:hypothetical protein JB92DRAFT_1525232 [Gautieria morchelliformis]|nr:hypothetical protein JB92DRAFT_1525232 [Gautieria morchelliformis]
MEYSNCTKVLVLQSTRHFLYFAARHHGLRVVRVIGFKYVDTCTRIPPFFFFFL